MISKPEADHESGFWIDETPATGLRSRKDSKIEPPPDGRSAKLGSSAIHATASSRRNS
jgi:hypothetical protein